MIGQNNIYNKICNLKYLPKCFLLIGNRGCEQIELINKVGSHFNLTTVFVPDLGVENIRKIIDMSYEVKLPTLYVFYEADNMSINAKNSLLKVIEEPPNDSYFMITLRQVDNTLPTIQSRAVTFTCDRYTINQLKQYYKGTKKYNSDLINLILTVCENPGDIDLLNEYNPQDFYSYVKTVIDNIDNVSISNCFKIADKINFKNDDSKYDLILFWKMFVKICCDKRYEDLYKYSIGTEITLKALRDIMRNSGINKLMRFDRWILDIRKEWLKIYDKNRSSC